MARRAVVEVARLFTADDGRATETTIEQKKVEDEVFVFLQQQRDVCLLRQSHEEFARRGLEPLPSRLQHLDASRPWIIYWNLHVLELLGAPITPEERDRCIATLRKCASPSGGFGGGPGQMPHLASTYAAANVIAILDCPEAYDIIDRAALRSFLQRMHQPDGSFIMHEGGEVDSRGAYCAASAAALAGVLDERLFENTGEWLASCQTYEGGFGGVPGCEAHGGYSFCSLAALVLLGKDHLINKTALLHWAAMRQMRLEGGFQGRTNKLVDGCYSFWVGGIFPLLHASMQRDDALRSRLAQLPPHWLYSTEGLQDYILFCCQWPSGGLIDKPSKKPDFYHSCYCLSGLASTQRPLVVEAASGDAPALGASAVCAIDPLHNVGAGKPERMRAYFRNK